MKTMHTDEKKGGEMKKDEELKFPILFTRCPACGCEDTVARQIKKEEVAKGKISPDANVAISQTVTPMLDQKKLSQVLSVTTLVSYYDICLKCGCYYCFRIDKGQGMVQLGGPQPPPDKTQFGFPQRDPRIGREG